MSQGHLLPQLVKSIYILIRTIRIRGNRHTVEYRFGIVGAYLISGVSAIFIELELAGNVYLSRRLTRLKIFSPQIGTLH